MRTKFGIPLIVLLAVALCCAVVAVGFAEKGDNDQKLTFEQLPPAVQATLQAQAQGNPIKDIEKETEDGVTFYSADVIQGDKKLGVEILENGQLKDVEPEAIKPEKDEQNEGNEAGEENEKDEVVVPFEQLPQAVQATFKAEAGSGTIDKVEMKNEKGAQVYSADITKDGQELDVVVAADGKLISNEPEKPKGHEGKCHEGHEEAGGDSD